jgi:hypothetical protein
MVGADDEACGCPFCRGDVPQEIVERIKTAAAGAMSKRMTLDEFRVWLNTRGPAADPPA